MTRRIFTATIAAALFFLAGSASANPTTIEHDGGSTTIETGDKGTNITETNNEGKEYFGENTPEDHDSAVDRVSKELERDHKNPKDPK